MCVVAEVGELSVPFVTSNRADFQKCLFFVSLFLKKIVHVKSVS